MDNLSLLVALRIRIVDVRCFVPKGGILARYQNKTTNSYVIEISM
jgi:hypothetical protein